MQNTFVRVLKYHTSLIEDLFAEGYDFIMTSRFQSDPLERRFSHIQMSGGSFLVGLKKSKDNQEKIIKLKTLLKDDIYITNIIDSNVEHDEKLRLCFIMLIFIAAQTKWLDVLKMAEK